METNGWVRVDGDSPTRRTGVAFCEADGKKWQFIYADNKPGNYTLRFPPNSLELAKVDNEESDSELELLVDNQMGYVTAVVPMGANDWREVLIDCLEDRGTPNEDAVAILDSLYPRPIPVSERLPEQSEAVLWFSGDSWEVGYLDETTLDGKKWWRPQNHWDICEITPDMFWMPLPPKPPAAEP